MHLKVPVAVAGGATRASERPRVNAIATDGTFRHETTSDNQRQQDGAVAPCDRGHPDGILEARTNDNRGAGRQMRGKAVISLTTGLEDTAGEAFARAVAAKDATALRTVLSDNVDFQ